MIDQCVLIVNADDFGLSAGLNNGIIRAHEDGIVTSASLMVRGVALEQAVTYARQHPRLSVGLHIDLGEWSFRNGQWEIRYAVVPQEEDELVRAEIYRQLNEFRRWMGCEPTHIDSHQHIHRDGPARNVAMELAAELAVPLRHVNSAVRYCGDFYGHPYAGESSMDAVSSDSLVKILGSLRPGITELACHPGIGQDIESDYVQEREWEVRALTDPAVRAAIDAYGVWLRSFGSPDVRERLRGGDAKS